MLIKEDKMAGMVQLAESLSSGYMAAQILTICMLFASGLLFVFAAFGGQEEDMRAGTVWRVLLAFPAGLALFSVSSYLLLCTGIPYNTYSAVTVIAAASVISVSVIWKKNRLVYINNNRDCRIILIVSIIAAVSIAVMSTANMLDVVLDNDSFFYFSAYPEAIVQEGAYIRYFDVFLTDAAPVGSVIQTLPYLFGFSETFGIQYFTDANFILIFAYAVYSELLKSLSKREALCCGLVSVLFLLTSSAYLITAKWIMAGVYFMFYYFLTAYAGYSFSFMAKKPYVLLALFAAVTAMMRHEGVVLLIILVAALSFLRGYTGRELCFSMICPALLMAGLYYIRVFLILNVHPLYAFLTSGKALVMTGALVLCGAYLLFIRDRLEDKLSAILPLLLPAFLILVNAGLMAVRTEAYLGNLKMFYLNVRIGAGWGYFGYIAGVIVLILVIKTCMNREWYLGFFDSLMISYVLGVLLVAFGRGDALRKGVGDSGNRVMLTAVPLIVFALVLRFFPFKEEK